MPLDKLNTVGSDFDWRNRRNSFLDSSIDEEKNLYYVLDTYGLKGSDKKLVSTEKFGFVETRKTIE